MPKQIYTLDDFSGGLNLVKDPSDFARNEVMKADFCSFENIGDVKASGTFNASGSAHLPDITHTCAGGYFAFETDHTVGSSAKTTGSIYIAGVDGLTGEVQLGEYSGGAGSPTAVDPGMDLGSVDSFTFNSNELTFTPYIAEIAAGSNDFEDAKIQSGDFIQITGATTVNKRNCYAYVNTSSASKIIFDTNGIGTSGSGVEGGTVTLKRLIKPVFYAAADDLRIADASMSASTKRKKYSYIKNIHFEDAGAAKNSYDNWYANDCSLNAPTELLLHATSYPTAGAGFHLTMTSTSGGSLPAKTYQIAGSFIYENGQESLLYIPSSSNTVAVTSNHYLDIDVRAENTADLTDGAYDERITGARVYIREDGTSDAWSLAVDISMKDGARTTLDSEYSPWANNSSVQAKVEGLKLMAENLETYTILNGFSPDEFSIELSANGEGYRDAIIANRRVFAANVGMIDEHGDGSEIRRMRDRIMYSPINKFDTFPRSFFIDVVQGDADEYTALATYADRLFAFKSKTLYIINISSPSPSNWFLESTEAGLGITHTSAVWTASKGLFWANKDSAYWYNGNQIINLTERRITSGADVRAAWKIKSAPSVFFNESNQSLYIKASSASMDDQGGAETLDNRGTWVYSLNADAWHQMRYDQSGTEENLYYSNVVLLNRSFYVGEITQNQNDGSLDTSSTRGILNGGVNSGIDWSSISPNIVTGKQQLITREIHFGSVNRIKKVYAATITYKSSASMTNPVSYITDGKGLVGGAYTDFEGNFADTGDANANDAWEQVRVTLSSPVECKSIKLKISNTALGSFAIKDISIEYREIYKRVS